MIPTPLRPKNTFFKNNLQSCNHFFFSSLFPTLNLSLPTTTKKKKTNRISHKTKPRIHANWSFTINSTVVANWGSWGSQLKAQECNSIQLKNQRKQRFWKVPRSTTTLKVKMKIAQPKSKGMGLKSFCFNENNRDR